MYLGMGFEGMAFEGIAKLFICAPFLSKTHILVVGVVFTGDSGAAANPPKTPTAAPTITTVTSSKTFEPFATSFPILHLAIVTSPKLVARQ
jgi:hypothetical protein